MSGYFSSKRSSVVKGMAGSMATMFCFEMRTTFAGFSSSDSKITYTFLAVTPLPECFHPFRPQYDPPVTLMQAPLLASKKALYKSQLRLINENNKAFFFFTGPGKQGFLSLCVRLFALQRSLNHAVVETLCYKIILNYCLR